MFQIRAKRRLLLTTAIHKTELLRYNTALLRYSTNIAFYKRAERSSREFQFQYFPERSGTFSSR